VIDAYMIDAYITICFCRVFLINLWATNDTYQQSNADRDLALGIWNRK